MNKLDDFLKSKMNNAELDSPSQWDVLNAALPAQTSGKGIAKWTFALLLLGGLVTTAVLLKYRTNESTFANSTNVSQTDLYENPAYAKLPGNEVKAAESIMPSKQSIVGSSLGTSSVSPVMNEVPPVPAIYEKKAAATEAPAYTTTVGESEKSSPVVEKKKNADEDNALENTDQKTEEIKNVSAGNSNNNAGPNSVTNTTIRKKERSEFHNGKLFVSASVSTILFSYRSFQLNNGAAPYVNKQYDDIRQNSESSILSYGASLAVEYKFAKSFSLQAGLSYNKIGFKSDYEFEITDKPLTNSSGRIIGYDNLPNPITTASGSKTKIDVFRIPFGLNYNIIINANSLFHLYLGGSHNVLLSATGMGLNQLTLEEKSISKRDFVNTANEACFDLGLNYALSPNYGLGIDLYYNRWLTDISKSKLENITPFTGGINLAITRKLF